jgi:hypothetical protein
MAGSIEQLVVTCQRDPGIFAQLGDILSRGPTKAFQDSFEECTQDEELLR